MTVGIYSLRSGPAAQITTQHFTDLTNDSSTSTLAVVTCETRNIQPQNVSWLRNGELLSINGRNYEMMQDLKDRTGSHYDNNLVIRDIFGLLNSPVYTCRIANKDFSLIRSVSVNIDISVQLEANIVASSTDAVLGDNYTLTCQTYTLQSKPTLTDPLLQRYLRVEWVDIDGNPITEEGSITFSELSSNFSHSINFNPLSEGQDRLYICVITVDIPETQSRFTAQYKYQIAVDIVFIQLKFDPIHYTFLSEYKNFVTDLENAIKQTLTDAINTICKCNFSPKRITRGEFSCIKSTSISYRARIEGSSDVQSTEQTMNTLQTWKRRYGTVLFSSSFSLRLWVDRFCPLEIRSFQEPLCHSRTWY